MQQKKWSEIWWHGEDRGKNGADKENSGGVGKGQKDDNKVDNAERTSLAYIEHQHNILKEGTTAEEGRRE